MRDLTGKLKETVRSITLLLVLTGLRIAELLALQWANVDLDSRILRILETVYDRHFDKPKTKRGRRTIPIGTETVAVLSALRPNAPQPITREVYLHAIPEEQRRAVNSVEKQIFGPNLDPSSVSDAEAR